MTLRERLEAHQVDHLVATARICAHITHTMNEATLAAFLGEIIERRAVYGETFPDLDDCLAAAQRKMGLYKINQAVSA